MEAINRQIYTLKFRAVFLESKGGAFETLFSTLMRKAYGNDFVPCRPWGRDGDRKNDGILLSEKTLFQVYAPNELSKDKTVRKIREDFQGALEHWGGQFSTWVFLHNDSENALPPHAIAEIISLQESHPDLNIEQRGYDYLRETLQRIPLPALEDWLGEALTAEDLREVGFEDLKVVLSHIESTPAPIVTEIREVSPGKLKANALSQDAMEILKLGMTKAPLVERFFESWHDPLYGERIATAFHQKYVALRDKLHRSDDILGELQRWSGGTTNLSPRYQIAVYAILAYLFDTCQIFEDAREVSSP